MFFADYFWKEGQPYGKGEVNPEKGFNIVKDPYKKRISIEKIRGGKFHSLIYDSNLFDFRKLKPEAQNAWQKLPLSDSESESSFVIKDQDDRTILIETYHFKEKLCHLAESFHPSGILVSRQKLFYKQFDDSFNGVILQDIENRPILFKEYDVDDALEFQNVLQEVWNFEKMKPDWMPIGS